MSGYSGAALIYSSSVPSDSEGNIGDIRFTPTPVLGGAIGWVRVASGWKTFGANGLRLYQRQTADLVKSNTTVGNPTGTSTVLTAGKVYRFRSWLEITASAAGGWKVSLGGTATATTLLARITGINGTTGAVLATGQVTALGTTVGESASGATAVSVQVNGTVVINAGGSFGPQFAQNTASGTSTCLANSGVEFWEVA